MVCGVYRLNLPGGRFYLGSSKKIESRYKEHVASLIKGEHFNKHLQRIVSAHGIDSISLSIVVETTERTREFIENWLISLKIPGMVNTKTFELIEYHFKRNPQSEEEKKKRSISAIRRWSSFEERRIQSEKLKDSMNNERRDIIKKKNIETWSKEEKLAEHSSLMTKIHSTSEGRKKQSERAKKRWDDWRKKHG